jgi:hypothetical protein
MGGECDQAISAETSKEMSEKMTAHVIEKHPDTAKWMKDMTPEEHQEWEKDFHRNWDEAPVTE